MTLPLSPSLAGGWGVVVNVQRERGPWGIWGIHCLLINRIRTDVESLLALWEGKATHSSTIHPVFPLVRVDGLGTYHRSGASLSKEGCPSARPR